MRTSTDCLSKLHPNTNFTTMVMVLRTIKGTLKYWTALMSPMSCPLRDFDLPPETCEKLHPLGARKRSSFNMANAFVRSRKPSSNVHNPIPAQTSQEIAIQSHSIIKKNKKKHHSASSTLSCTYSSWNSSLILRNSV